MSVPPFMAFFSAPTRKSSRRVDFVPRIHRSLFLANLEAGGRLKAVILSGAVSSYFPDFWCHIIGAYAILSLLLGKTRFPPPFSVLPPDARLHDSFVYVSSV